MRSNYNAVSGNNITENSRYGLLLAICSDNIIYHNNFVDNTEQVYTDGSINLWDDGYPSGGNFWSDYTGVDFFSGPYQNENGSDGIGDTAYTIYWTLQDRYPLMNPRKPEYTFTTYSSPTGVTFTIDDVSHTTPWSETYDHGTLISPVMPQAHTVGEARYYWDKWSDEVTNRSRTVIINRDITLTGLFTGPYYELTVISSPITGITFIINESPQTTPYTEWLLEGSYILQMPETYNGYVWSHWLEDGDTNRIKTITLPGTTYTAVYTLPPIGGTTVTIQSKPSSSWITPILLILTIAVASGIHHKHKKPSHKQKHFPTYLH